MSAIQIVIGIALIVVSVFIVILVMLQESKAELSGTIAGGSASDSFFGKNRGRTKDAQLRKLTIILGSVFGVLTLVSSLLLLFFSNK
ncbi:MAG: preprotein translocase subunit SecG [Clostridia bacterium]|nr:preprotein translocase subunit SecG [Clostridia bacterium]